MLAVTANRTRIHFNQRHLCTQHMKKVDKNHIDECELLNTKHKPTYFNQALEETPIHDIRSELKQEILEHFEALSQRIKLLTTQKIFVEVDNRIQVQA